MLNSHLFLRHYSAIVAAVLAISVALYVFTVPLIRETTYEIERAAGRNVLDVVFDLTNRIHLNIETQRHLALESRKRELRNVLGLARAHIDVVAADYRAGRITRDSAYTRIYDGLRRFKYGNNDYIWVADYDAVLVSHPDPSFQGTDVSSLVRDASGDPAVPQMIAIARRDGDGFYSYRWNRLGGAQDNEKLSYFEDFPDWGFVVGTGVYLDDVEADVMRHREAAISEMRAVLRDLRIAKTGYVYIFDANLDMLVHPNPNIEQTHFGELLNPLSSRSIGDDLIAAADDHEGLYYQWDSPQDPGNYVYEKISWVRHFEGFDWYIASSIYVDELRRNADTLANRIVAVAITSLIIALLLSYLFVRRLTVPIRQMATTALRIQAGDLTATSGIERDDEIGVLSRSMDGMVKQLRENIDTLDSKVDKRTAQLEQANAKLRDVISAEQSASRALTRSERRQRLVLDSLPDAIAYLDANRRIGYANRPFVTTFSVNAQVDDGCQLDAVMTASTYADYLPYLDRAYAGERVRFEQSYQRSDGTDAITDNHIIPDIQRDQAVGGAFFLSRDITEEKQTAKRLLDTQRMQAVGHLSGGLAHDFNNLLTVILGNLEAAREKYPTIPELDDYLGPAIRASRRGANITSRLLAFSRRQPLAPHPTAIDDLVAETIVLLGRSLPSNVIIKFNALAGPYLANVDAGQLENALVNLAINASDAMPDGGLLTFSVAQRQIAEGVVYDEPVATGDYIEIRVSDNGTSFSEEALQRAFEPFYTTKGSSSGSGLGLSMVYGFVKQSNGYIRIDGNTGTGADVTLLLPAQQHASAPIPSVQEPTVPDTATSWQGRLVLLVEDDTDVRAVVRRDLVALGFSVIEAAEGKEALALLTSIDTLYLLISDVIMPGSCNGLELARRAAKLRPHLPVVLISGYAEHITPQAGDDAFPLLRKPFGRQELCATLAAATQHRTAETSE